VAWGDAGAAGAGIARRQEAGGRGPFERKIAALGRDDDGLARSATGLDEPAERPAHGPLAPLAAIVDGGVHDVDPRPDRPLDGGFVLRVGRVVVWAEVGPDADRGERQAATVVEVAVRSPGASRGAVGCGALGRRPTLEHGKTGPTLTRPLARARRSAGRPP